jgi:hypothetical protein
VGQNWNIRQVAKINSTITGMIDRIDQITVGYGQEWVQKNLDGSIIDLGGGFSYVLNSSYVSGSTVHLLANFENLSWGIL